MKTKKKTIKKKTVTSKRKPLKAKVSKTKKVVKKKIAPKKSIRSKKVKSKTGKKLSTVGKMKVKKASAVLKPIGLVTHYYDKIGVAIVSFNKAVSSGISVRFKGSTTDFLQTISSMQLNYKSVTRAPKSKEIGVKVKNRVREGDFLFTA